jgi:AraC family transcriptional regulator, regulatory protein of adaptative response / methylated-DNA-[protein]-cysteine methyltransferase
MNIEIITPAEYKKSAEALHIKYNFFESPFGQIIIATTAKGICYLAFAEDEQQALLPLQKKYPHENFIQTTDAHQQQAILFFTEGINALEKINLHISGTSFQLNVWNSLLKIPMGNVTSYGAIARDIKQPTAARAVGTAIGNNPVALLIPCHRVIQASGKMGGYMWGSEKKAAIIHWEAAQKNKV